MPRKTDPQSIKEALTGRDIADLKQSIAELTKTMKEGFDGIHTRQDTTNGKVLKAGNDILELKTETDKKVEALRFRFNYSKIIWYMFTAAMVLITSLVMYIVTHQYH